MAGSTGVPARRPRPRPPSPLDGLPAWATTGVGSLPHTFPDLAAAHVVGEYDVPFCPQLPRLEGDMVGEWLGADPLRCGWTPDRDRERPAAWEDLLAALARHPPAHGVVKLQVTGPVTLARALEPARTDRRGLAREIASWLAANVAGQVEELRRRSLTALVVVDEPALAAEAPVPETVWDPLRGAAPAWGLHLCCAVPWELVERAEPDVLSFDLALGLDRAAARALGRRLARGGRIAWGVLAAHRAERAAHAAWRLSAALARVGATAAAAGPSSLLTASCGTGRLSPRREAEVTAALHAVATAARRPAGP